jgi:ubiquitin-activating enzyme E1
MVANVSNDSPALVTVLEDSRHRLETGDIVSMTELEGGLAALNGREFRVNVKDPYSFEIDVDTSAMGNYVRGGYLTEVKKPRIVSFKTLAEAILDPGMFVGDFSKSHHMGPLHLAVRALRQFRSAYGRLPSPGCLSDATTLYSTCLSLNASTAGFNVEGLEDHESLLRRVAMCARGVVSPVCGILGGVVGQEVLKACSGKFSPIQQWYYLDGEDALPDTPLSEEEVSPLGCRYDGQIMVFGRQMQHKLQKYAYTLE